MVRPSSVDKNGMKKGAWSREEDNKLRDYIQRYSHWNWRLLPKYAGLSRCGKSCRLRWVNYLKPGIKRGNLSKYEEELIIGLQSRIGNKWSAIAARLPGRTDNEIKNFWHSQIKKRIGKRSLPYSTNTVKASITTDDHQKYDDELGLGFDQMDNIALKNLESNSSYSIDEPEELEFWTDQHSFPADKTYTQNANQYLPPVAVIPDEEIFDYPELYNNELSSSNSSCMSATATSLEWITDDDYSSMIISSDHYSVLDDQHNTQCNRISSVLPQEVGTRDGGGRFYDHSFPYF